MFELNKNNTVIERDKLIAELQDYDFDSHKPSFDPIRPNQNELEYMVNFLLKAKITHITKTAIICSRNAYRARIHTLTLDQAYYDTKNQISYHIQNPLQKNTMIHGLEHINTDPLVAEKLSYHHLGNSAIITEKVYHDNKNIVKFLEVRFQSELFLIQVQDASTQKIGESWQILHDESLKRIRCIDAGMNFQGIKYITKMSNFYLKNQKKIDFGKNTDTEVYNPRKDRGY